MAILNHYTLNLLSCFSFRFSNYKTSIFTFINFLFSGTKRSYNLYCTISQQSDAILDESNDFCVDNDIKLILNMHETGIFAASKP